MHVSFNLAAAFDAVLKTAATSAGFDTAEFSPEVRTADPKHGDFQANGVLPYAKRTKQNPRALAEKLVAALPAEVREAAEVVIAGPGFINFTLKPGALQAWLRVIAAPTVRRPNSPMTTHPTAECPSTVPAAKSSLRKSMSSSIGSRRRFRRTLHRQPRRMTG